MSDYLAADKDGYVNVWWDKDSAWISLINGTPENGTNKNYKITPTDESARRIKSTNVFEVADRDLSTVVATIKPVKAKQETKLHLLILLTKIKILMKSWLSQMM